MLNTFFQFSRGAVWQEVDWKISTNGSVTTECDDLRQDRREKK
jgi:hypothetical protein